MAAQREISVTARHIIEEKRHEQAWRYLSARDDATCLRTPRDAAAASFPACCHDTACRFANGVETPHAQAR